MHNLMELWALLALFLSKIFDQITDSEWSADVGLISFGGQNWGSETGALFTLFSIWIDMHARSQYIININLVKNLWC